MSDECDCVCEENGPPCSACSDSEDDSDYRTGYLDGFRAAQEARPDDIWTLVLCTLRYAMGRRSYITGLACDLVRRYARLLTQEQLAQIATEIRAEIHILPPGQTLGDAMDQREFERLATAIESNEVSALAPEGKP